MAASYSRHANCQKCEHEFTHDAEVLLGLQVASSEGGLHVLINNAGIFPLGPVELLAEEVRRSGLWTPYVRHCRSGKTSAGLTLRVSRLRTELGTAMCSGSGWQWR
jgi:NAD(P)-dependent dehydrogenase (short-subunit alcohol dehydrogenase family)